MKIIELELSDDIADRLDEIARALDTSPEDVALAGIEEKLSMLKEEFRALTSNFYIVDSGIELYRPPG